MVQMVMMIKNITAGLLSASIAVHAENLHGKVVHITDGDTLTILAAGDK